MSAAPAKTLFTFGEMAPLRLEQGARALGAVVLRQLAGIVGRADGVAVARFAVAVAEQSVALAMWIRPIPLLGEMQDVRAWAQAALDVALAEQRVRDVVAAQQAKPRRKR